MSSSTNNLSKKGMSNYLILLLVCAVGIGINLICNLIADAIGIPLFLDTIGTILASCLGGYLPGIIVAIATNYLKELTHDYSVYYGIVNVLIAVVTVYFHKKGYLKKPALIVIYILILAVLGGCIGAIMDWLLEGATRDDRYTEYIEFFSEKCGMGDFAAEVAGEFVIDLVDKILTVLVAMFILSFVSDSARDKLRFSGWKQKPLSDEEKERLKSVKSKSLSLRTKIVLVLLLASLFLATAATWISLILFRNYTRDQHSDMAYGITDMMDDVIDGDSVDTYLELGEAAEGYSETEQLLYTIKGISPDIEYVYVYKILEDGCHVVFDLDTEDLEGEEPGTVIPFDESFSDYIPALLAGEEIEPIISDDTYGWLLTVYKPIYNSRGKCVCYAAVDVAMKDLTHYEREFFIKLIALFLGFFILIVAIGLWLAEYHIILPVNSMAARAGEFAYDNDENRAKNVEIIKSLDIETGDEVENLYRAFLKNTEDTARYVDELQEKTQTISEMQRGLIMVLADMVENRDESTGDHVRKTAAYTKIIMNGLRKLGYYKEELTDQFVSDVVYAAPLHDVGKIQVPDAVLNKPGKLTDDEFEIMKSHTTKGAEILEQAIESVPGASYLNEAKNLAAYHHEKWNGKGYPYGKAGEDIPLSARIMAVADVFDALVSKRCYKEPFTFEKAMDIIKEDAGTHFDPKVVEAFVNSEDEVREVAEHFDRIRVLKETKRPDKD